MSGTVTNPFAGVAHYIAPATASSLQDESILQDVHGNLIVTTTDGQTRVFLSSAASPAVIPAASAGTTASNPFSSGVARFASVYQGCRYPIAPLGTTVAQVPTQPAGTGDPNVLAIFRLNGAS